MAEQPQLWDGTGVDPWLPARFAAELRVVLAEQSIYGAWWEAFSSWIVTVERSVMSGPVPDPNAVWAHTPLWAEWMASVVAGPVTDAVGQSFAVIFGPDYHFDARPAVVRHLASVTNRMASTPAAVFDAIAAEVAKGASSGASIQTIADSVEDVLTASGTATWQGRAVTIARTETIGSLNAGRQDSFVAVSDLLGGDFENQWLSTLGDGRTRPDHVEADLQRVPVGTPFTVCGEHLMFPGAPEGSAACTVNCRCTTLLVRPGEHTDLSDRGWQDF